MGLGEGRRTTRGCPQPHQGLINKNPVLLSIWDDGGRNGLRLRLTLPDQFNPQRPIWAALWDALVQWASWHRSHWSWMKPGSSMFQEYRWSVAALLSSWHPSTFSNCATAFEWLPVLEVHELAEPINYRVTPLKSSGHIKTHNMAAFMTLLVFVLISK